MLKIIYGFLKDFLENPEKFNAIQTGSRKFNCSNLDKVSDYDFFIKKEDWLRLGKDMDHIYDYNEDGSGNYADNGLFNSIHLLYDGKDFNIIVCNTDIEFECWKFATDSFNYLIQRGYKKFNRLLKDKNLRIELFESFKCTMRTLLTKEAGISEYKKISKELEDDNICY